jgi:general secretion pathway protein E
MLSRMMPFGAAERSLTPRADDAASAAPRLIAVLRQAGRVKVRDDLPPFRMSLSKSYDIAGNELSAMAVLDLGQREAAILVCEQSVGARAHMELRRRVEENGYSIKWERISDIALIVDVNNAINKNTSDAGSSDVKPLIEEMIRDAVAERATDIHICCREASGMVLFRIHGDIYQYRGFDVATCDQIAGYMFTEMAESSSRSKGTFSVEAKSMSCMIRTTVGATKYKLRYKFIRVADGWDVIIRVLPVEKAGEANKTFEQLGYSPSQIKQIVLAVGRSIGLIAITGPTGSGKSTTLKTMMEQDPKRMRKKRYSVEDPVEYKIFGVSQIAVQRSDHDEENAGKDATTGALKDILRGDPNDIMVGEIRDDAMASMATDLVLTGHKIYTTLHTASAFGAALRLHRLGLDRHVMADRKFISALMFQRLLPVLCGDCSVPASDVLPPLTLHLIEMKFKLAPEAVRCKSVDGCVTCNHRGIVDSTVVAEIVVPDKKIRGHFANGESEQAEEYWRASRTTAFDHEDMTGKTAFEHALYKMSLGMIDPRDIEQEFEPFESYEVVERTEEQ